MMQEDGEIVENHQSPNGLLDRTQSSGGSDVVGVGGFGSRTKVFRTIEDYGKFAHSNTGAPRPQGKGLFSFKESSVKVSFSSFFTCYFGCECLLSGVRNLSS